MYFTFDGSKLISENFNQNILNLYWYRQGKAFMDKANILV